MPVARTIADIWCRFQGLPASRGRAARGGSSWRQDGLRGRMHRGVFPFPRDRGFDVPVADPRQSRDFASAGGAPAKTDRVDAGIPVAFATCRCRASILRTGAPPGRSRPPTFRRGTGECGRSGWTTAPLEVRGRGSLAHLVEPVSRPAETSRRADPVRPDARPWTGLWRDCGQSTPDTKKPQKRPNSRLTQNMDAFCSFPQAGECSP